VNVYPFIEAEEAGRRNVRRACELLKVSRAAFYQHLKGPSRRGQDADLTREIRGLHQEPKGRYGAPRVHAELRRRGRRHSRKRVARRGWYLVEAWRPRGLGRPMSGPAGAEPGIGISVGWSIAGR
jgi:hypothetical protein